MDALSFPIESLSLVTPRRQVAYECFDIVTLGPPGTSSEHAAKKIIKGNQSRIKLFSTYEAAEQHMLANPEATGLLVANAYQHINRFYISSRNIPVAAFFIPTPPYLLASKASVQHQDKIRISSHKAPSHLIGKLLEGREHELVEAHSTSQAARMVTIGDVDACLTTRPACEAENLVPISKTFIIPMLWTLFLSKEEYS
ncbi:hypothetical protein [Halomonas sp. Y3]|uniref:hypothetical protein n=1 Tax=Halomonas sp. Y3 TaxID=2956797 RepID=UPI0020A07665|nr:hypothetical protein [Halomonas sp. Y3]